MVEGIFNRLRGSAEGKLRASQTKAFWCSCDGASPSALEVFGTAAGSLERWRKAVGTNTAEPPKPKGTVASALADSTPWHAQHGMQTTEMMVCLLPPPELWPRFVELKEPLLKPSLKEKGRAAFPHITLLQTHIDAKLAQTMPTVEAALRSAFAKQPPVHLDMHELDTFDHHGWSTLFVTDTSPEATTQLTDLYNATQAALPSRSSSQPFAPHIGLGTVPASEVDGITADYSRRWSGASFDCAHVYVLLRGAIGPWTVVAALPMCGAAEPMVAVGSVTTSRGTA